MESGRVERRLSLEELTGLRQQSRSEREYWAQKLAGELDKAVIQPDRKTPAGQPRLLASHLLTIAGPAFTALERLHNRSERRLHMILTAAVALLLKRYTGRQEIILGAPVLKQVQEVEFINTVLPLRLAVPEEASFKDLILSARQTIEEATVHQNYPLRLLLEQLGLPTDTADFPLFEVAVLLENIHDQRYIDHLNPRLTFAFRRADDGLSLRLDYDASRYEEQSIARLGSHFACLLERAVADISQTVAALGPIPEDERRQLLLEFNSTAGDYPAGRSVAQLFTEQVARTPEAVAVVCGEQRLTFAELDRRANQLAHHLRGQGVGPESVVAVLLDPSLDMIVAILGVMKAGGAFLPLDPGYPRERIRTILDGSEAKIILSDSRQARRLSFTSLQGLHLLAAEPLLTTARTVISDLDQLPIPDRSLVDYDRYANFIGQGMVKNTYINLLSTRGCPFGCAYCHKIWPRGHQRRSPENILEEIRFHYDLGVRRFIFVDDVFNLDRQACARFFELVLTSGMKLEIFFSGGLRGDLLDPALIDLMVEAGTVSLALALESASSRLQKFIGKNLNLERFDQNITYLCQKYPQVVQELFTMHGFPTETEEEAWQTLEFVKKLRWVHMPYLNILRIYANTEMERLALAHGVSAEAIFEAEKLPFYEIPDTLPFSRAFTAQVQSEFLNNYFLLKERLLAVLPHQMRLFSESEIVQKYDSYLPVIIDSFAGLLRYAGIDPTELGPVSFQPEDHHLVPDLGRRLAEARPARPAPVTGADKPLRLMLLDLSQYFSSEEQVLYDVFEPPLGLMYLLTHLRERFAENIDGRIYKSRVDFDSLDQLKRLYDEFQPDVIGVRGLTLYKDFFHRAVAALRQWGFSGPLIAGGPYPTSGHRSMLQDANIDLAVLGEGELTLAELMVAILSADGGLPDENTLRGIAGLAFAHGGRLRGSQARRVLMLDQAEPLLSTQPGSDPVVVNRPQNLAYIIYTSGSTGEPKGIMEEQEAFVDFVTWSVAEFEHRTGYQVLLSNSYASAGAIQQIFPPLITGGALHLIDPDLRRDVSVYVDYLREHRINNIDEVPVILNLIFDLLPLDEGRELLPDLTCLSVGSEYIPIELIRQCRRYLNHNGRIINAYGQAEAASETATYHFDGRDPDEKSLIGRPRRNLRVYILDPCGHLCPLGVPGELCVSGVGLARGYLNRPELTAAKFAANPHSDIPGDRLYHTGDFVRWLPNGNLEFLGRIDHQVQVRGYRVELAEIEHHLRRHPEVKDVVVNALKDERGELVLCAYYVAGGASVDTCAPDAADLRRHLAASLPEYMIPIHFLRLERLPLNPNGKVDRKSLPRPLGPDGSQGQKVAPRDALEQSLAAIWSAVLDLDAPIGIDDNFFALGGHSLKTTLLKLRIHKELGLEVPLREIFQRPTIRDLGLYLAGLAPATGAPGSADIAPAPAREHYPLSLEQERLFTMQQFDQDFVGYNLPAALVLAGPVDAERLEAAFNTLVTRHAALRTGFQLFAGTPAQFVLPEASVRLSQPRSGRSPADAVAVADHLKGFIRPFDLARAPLMRLELLEIDPALAQGQTPVHLLLVDMPHIVSDGISVWVLVDEFSRLYAGQELPPVRRQYPDYAVWQREGDGARLIAAQRDYWLDQFRDPPPRLAFAPDFPRPRVMDFAGAGVRRSLPEDLAVGLRTLARAEGATPYMLLLAAYFALLHRHTGQEDLVIGSPTAGRSHADLQETVGMFVNMLALRGRPRAGMSFRQLLGQVRETALGSFQHQDYQFVDLVRELNLPRDPGRNPLFDAVFELINISLNQIELPGATVSNFQFDTGVTPFELLLVLTEDGDKLDLELRHATSLYRPETAQALAEDYLTILRQVLERPDAPLSALRLAEGSVLRRGVAGDWDRSAFAF